MNEHASMRENLALVAQHLLSRREVILSRWYEEVDGDEEVGAVARLTRVEFRDHMPQILDALDARLRDWPREKLHTEYEELLAGEHGAHRWQQGYDLNEMAREWGLINLVLLLELDSYGLLKPCAQATTLPRAREILARFTAAGISGSIAEFYYLQRAEAETRARELEDALGELREHQRTHGELLREASHDLRGGLSVVQGAIGLLEWERLPVEQRATTLRLLQSGVDNVQRLLTDVLDLARLEAGREKCEVAPFDAAQTIRALCENSRPLANDRSLWLHVEGPENLPVQGDGNKVARIAQNLLLNALRYTTEGGVTVSVKRCEEQRWMLTVRDTGPGLEKHSPLTHELGLATQAARNIGALSSESVIEDASGEGLSSEENDTQQTPALPVSVPMPSGEGIGLSIVKKLCDILDASLELDSSASGSEFRVVFPAIYEKQSTVEIDRT